MWCALIPHTYQPRLWHAAGCSPLQGFERPLCLATALVSLWIYVVIIPKVLVIGQDLQRGRRHCIACSRGYHLIRRSQPPLAGELAKKERWCHLLAESLRGAVRECVGGEGKLRLWKKTADLGYPGHLKVDVSLLTKRTTVPLLYPFESMVIASWEFLVSFCGSI